MKYYDLNEKRHGTEAFPLEYFYLDEQHERYVMTLHWHNEFEIIHVISGTLKLYLDNVEYTLNTDDYAFIEYGMLHRAEPISCQYECTVFDLNMLKHRHGNATRPFISGITNGSVSVKPVLESYDNTEIKSILEMLFKTIKTADIYHELIAQGLLTQFIGQLYTSGYITPTTGVGKTRQNSTMSSLLDWIETHFTEHITLADLSRVSGLNEKYLCSLFKNYTGKTPLEFINGLRIDAACHEMFVNGKTITEVSSQCGFNDASYFSRVFKKYKQKTPKKYLSEQNKAVGN